MRLPIILFVLFVILSSCEEKTNQSPPEEQTTKQYSIEQFMDNEEVSGGSFSADNSQLLFSSNQTGIFNVYTIATTGGETTAITSSDSTSYYAVSFFPEDNRMLLSADNNGDEISHLFVCELDGQIKDITPTEGANTSFYGWSKDKKYLYFGSNKRDKRFFDVYKLSTTDYSSQLIYKNEEGLNFSGISDNEQYFALSKTINTNDNDLFIYDVKTKERIQINTTQSANLAQVFAEDNKTFYYTTDNNAEFSYLMAYDITAKTHKKVLEKPWDIAGIVLTANNQYMVVYTNEDGKRAIEVLKMATMQAIELPNFGQKSITSVRFSEDEKWMRMYAGGSNRPSDLFTYQIDSKQLHQLTNVLNPAIAPSDLVQATVIRYPSFDNTEIPAIYYLPHQASKKNKVPALVWVHGGPGGQSTQSFNALIQYLVNHGYAILAVNNRGSSGYGKTFYKMDDQNHGEKDLQDCVEGKNWLANQVEIDPDKIGIMGGSYGGYMTMAALCFTPDEFNVGINLFGVTNWMRTLKSIPPYWESFRAALYLELGDPYSDDSVRLKKISPLFHAENVTKPLMVLQGAQDPRVLQVESDEIVAAVRKNKIPVEYVLFDDEGHGFDKKKNQLKAYSSILTFIDTYLKGTTTEKEAQAN